MTSPRIMTRDKYNNLVAERYALRVKLSGAQVSSPTTIKIAKRLIAIDERIINEWQRSPGVEELPAPVSFCTKVYRSTHGAEPRGRGLWGFVMGKADYSFVDEKDAAGRNVVWFAPSAQMFGVAKRLALTEAQSRGVTLVGVCP